MELRHLRYFVAVAEELHFGRAAARVHTAQSSLSSQIRDLEDELGVQLLSRTKRQVRLTDAGRVFLVDATAVLKKASEAVRTVQRTNRGEVGRLGIGFVPSADCISFPEILRAFKQRFPEIHIELRNLSGSEQISALLAGEIDVGFLRPMVVDARLKSEPIAQQPIALVLPRRHRLLAKSQVALSDLAEESLVLCSRQHAPLQYDVIIASFRALNLVPNVLFETDHVQTILGLVAAGMGVSLLPASVEDLRAPGLTYRPLKKPAPEMTMAIAYRDRDASRALANFLIVVRELARNGFRTSRKVRSSRSRQAGHRDRLA
jgi:DNA-binding transcriptional LysR family regulator